MLKIRLIAAIIAIVFTALTILIVPHLYAAVVHFGDSHPHGYQWLQVILGFGVAGAAFWRWMKSRSKKKDQ